MTVTTVLSPPPEAHLSTELVSMLEGIRVSTAQPLSMENYSALRRSRPQRKAFLEPGMKISMQFCPSCGHWLSCLYRNKCLLRIVHLLWDGETQPVKGAGILVSKRSCYFWAWLLGSSFPWSRSVYLKHHPFFFIPPLSKVLFLLWCFQMFRLQFFRLWKKNLSLCIWDCRWTPSLPRDIQK